MGEGAPKEGVRVEPKGLQYGADVSGGDIPATAPGLTTGPGVMPLALKLPMTSVWALSVLTWGRCFGLGLEENRSSKSTSDAPAEPRNEAVFLFVSFPCDVRFPAIK